MFQQAASQFAGFVGDLFTDRKGLGVLFICLGMQAEFFVTVGNLGQSVRGSQLRLDTQFLIRDFSLGDSNASDITFETSCHRLHLASAIPCMNFVEIDQPDFVGRKRLQDVVIGDDLVRLDQRNRGMKYARMDTGILFGRCRRCRAGCRNCGLWL